MVITKENIKKGERTKEERKPKKNTRRNEEEKRKTKHFSQTPIQVYVAYKT